MNDIKMIITDLDETLLHSDKSISVYTKYIFSKCKEYGIKTAVATARYWIGAERYILELNPDYEITTDGTLIHNSNQLIYGCGFDIKTTNDIINELKNLYLDIEITVATGRTVYWNSPHIAKSDRLYKAVYHDFSEPLTDCGYKIAVELPSPDRANDIAVKFDCKMISYRDENLYAFVNKNSGKVKAIQSLVKELSIDIENIVAFGDDVNDIEMLKTCGLGIAVANAVPSVKEIADEIIDSNNDDGVAKYIASKILRI